MDVDQQAGIDQLYTAIESRLEEHREAFLEYAEKELLTTTRQAPPVVTSERREAERRSQRRTYLRKQLESIPKHLRILIERGEKQSDSLANDDTTAEIRNFLSKRIEQLKGEHEAFKTRVENILTRVRAKTTDRPANATPD